jgi:hypothetical protein
MRIKGLLIATFSLIGISGAFAQGIEYDDMYFTAEDRAKLKQKRAAEVAYNAPAKSSQLNYYDESESVNPTDSYSARNVNPEYTSRSHSQTAQSDEADYFVNNYQYNANRLDNWNNNYNNWYSNSWYRPNYYGPGINTWNSPYYGYSSWNSPWYDPFWSHNGWSSSFAFHHGRSWNYGWGGNYNYWNRPYYGWDPYGMAYGGGYGMGYGGGYWNNYRYPGTIIVVNQGESNGHGVVYGKRPTRGTTLVSDRNNVRSRSGISNSVREDNSSGRVSTSSSSRKQAEYYNRYNRPQRSTTSDYGSRSNTQYNRSRSWDNSSWDSNNSYNNSRSSTPSYSPSRSSSSGSGTRTSSGSTGGSRGRD